MKRYIDTDELIRSTINNPLHVPYITKKDIDAAPTADVVPIWFIRSEMKYTDGVYSKSMRILLEKWERKKKYG